MIKSNTLLLILSLFIFSSCGEFFYYREKKEFSKKYILKKPKSFCSTSSKDNLLEIAGSSQKAIKIFQELVIDVPQIRKLSLVELSVMWGLFQLNVRPDLVSPTSRLQVMVKINNKMKYFQFDVAQSTTPFLNGLEYLLKKYQSKKSLKFLANLLYQNLPRTIPIDNDFSIFLKKNESELRKHDQFTSVYFKASQVVRKGESIPKINFRKMISRMDQRKRKSPTTHLFTSTFQKQKVKCNIDLGLYQNNVFLISQQEEPDALPIGISKRNGDHIFLVMTNQLESIKPYGNFFNFEGKAIGNPMVFCHLINPENKNEFTIVSSKSRDPGQFIFHLLNIDLQKAQTLSETQEYINFPRHLFLRNPDRLIYESNKGSEEQLRNYLTLNFPLYHQTHLGRVWMHAKMKKLNESGILLDSRTEAALACIK